MSRRVAERYPRIRGYCPMGCGQTLFVAEAGYITCCYLDCPAPDAVSTILDDREKEHIVVIGKETFTVQHPLRERLNGDMFECELHQWLTALSGPPAGLGRWRVYRNGPTWTFARAETS